MNSSEKEISYTNTNTYSTLNNHTSKTKNIWFVCHGMGYLSRYFIRYFKNLDPEENYIIAPQAQSKYYLGQQYKHVGASWLTRENTLVETENIMRYFDTIFAVEQISDSSNLIVLGYSQGVSVAMRYVSKRRIQCSQLILHSGGIPTELTAKDFDFFKGQVKLVYGLQDEFLNEARITQEQSKAKSLFGELVDLFPFEGTHIVNSALIKTFIKHEK